MNGKKPTPAEAELEKQREEHQQVMALQRAILVLCTGQDPAVAGVAVMNVLISLRRADSGLTRAGACRALSNQFAEMSKEPEPS